MIHYFYQFSQGYFIETNMESFCRIMNRGLRGWVRDGRGPGLSGLSGLDQDKRGWVEDWKGEGWKIGRGRGGRLEEGGMEECKLKEAQSRMNVAQRKRTI